MDYTRFMGGMDRADQLRSYYSCSQMSMAWWKKLLYFLIDVARVNAWLCYKAKTQDEPGVPVSHRMFTVGVATGLIAGFTEGTPTIQPVPRSNIKGHQCIRLPDKHPKMCIQCRQQGRSTPKDLL